MHGFFCSGKSLVNLPSYPAVCPVEWNYDSVVHHPRQANSFVYGCSVAQCRKSNLFQGNSPPFLLNLVPQGQVFAELTIRHRDNSKNTRKIIHINLPKSNKAEHFNF